MNIVLTYLLMQKARDIGILNKMAYKDFINDPNST